MENKIECPKCGSTKLCVERRLNGNASCTNCNWRGPYKDCFTDRDHNHDAVSVTWKKDNLIEKSKYEELQKENEFLKNEINVHKQTISQVYDIQRIKDIYNENKKLKDENERLKKILSEEFSENDQYGMEYTGIVLLKDKVNLLKKKLELAISQRDQEIKFRAANDDEWFQRYNSKRIEFLNSELEKLR